MAVGYPAQDDPFISDSELLPYGVEIPATMPGGIKLDGVSIAAVILLLFLGFQLKHLLIHFILMVFMLAIVTMILLMYLPHMSLVMECRTQHSATQI